MKRRRVNLKAILADQDLRRELMVPTIQALQAREGIETTRDQAERAYYVVNEADKAAFFDLEKYRGGKRSEPDRREEMFVRALGNGNEWARLDVARRDFETVDTSPLAYRRVSLVGGLFRQHPVIKNVHGTTHVGVFTHGDSRFLRERWECQPNSENWVPFWKGGDYCRFYSDSTLTVDWSESAKDYYRKHGRIRDVSLYFRGGLTWVPRTQRGFSLRVLPDYAIFGNKGPTILLKNPDDSFYLLGVGNSHVFDYLTGTFAAFGSYEAKSIEQLPVPASTDRGLAEAIASRAESIFLAKRDWDTGNETSSLFERPWLVYDNLGSLTIPDRLDRLAESEATEETHIQQLYGELNDAVYKLYGIPAKTRAIIEETLGKRPTEILWPQMEGKTTDQKRMEHVWRLLSYVVKRVVDADEDGIVPFMAAGGETSLIDRVRSELAVLFPDQDINQVEVDITNELKRKVKGYRSVESIREWLEDIFFDYHVSLYKKRPIIWHIASSQGRGACAIGALAHYHKFDRDRLAKLRGSYLRDAIAHFRREAGLADQEGRTEDRQEWQTKLEEAQVLDQRLQWVQEGAEGHPAPGDCRIRTPWKSEDELPTGWQPDLDDGVAVNILPLQTAGVLRIPKVV